MDRPDFGHHDGTTCWERGGYWEFRFRNGSRDSDAFEDHPEYRVWTVGFRLTRTTLPEGESNVQDSGT